jgi:hypothetical protein
VRSPTKRADADLRTLQVGHDRDLLADLAGRLANECGAVDVVLRLAVREVEPHDVNAGADHALEDFGRARRRPERGDDLGGAVHGGFHRTP